MAPHATIGPYSFSLTDVRRTLAAADALFDHLAAGRGPAADEVLGEFRRHGSRGLGDLDPMKAEPEVLLDPLERFWAAWTEAGPALRAAGVLPATATGTVAGLHRSGGGVPKTPVERVEVDFGGVVGDRQAARTHHGRPWQALCLWSAEVIAALAADGHTIHAGAAGENVTVGGLDWGDVAPGVRLQLGGVVCEVSSYAVPCSKNAQWFSDGDFDRIHHRHGPISRVYATVLEPGAIAVGDPVVLEP